MVRGVQTVGRVVDVLVKVTVSVCAFCRCSGLRLSVRSCTTVRNLAMTKSALSAVPAFRRHPALHLACRILWHYYSTALQRPASLHATVHDQGRFDSTKQVNNGNMVDLEAACLVGNPV